MNPPTQEKTMSCECVCHKKYPNIASWEGYCDKCSLEHTLPQIKKTNKAEEKTMEWMERRDKLMKLFYKVHGRQILPIDAIEEIEAMFASSQDSFRRKVEDSIKNMPHDCSEYHPCTCQREDVIDEIIKQIQERCFCTGGRDLVDELKEQRAKLKELLKQE